MTVEDSTVPIIGSDTERLENGEGRRSESEEENMINKETITVEDEGMDKGGWAWVVVLGEPLFITRSTILFLLAGDALCVTMVNVMFTLTFVTFILSFLIVFLAASFLCNMVIDGLGYSFGVLLEPIQREFQVKMPICLDCSDIFSIQLIFQKQILPIDVTNEKLSG